MSVQNINKLCAIQSAIEAQPGKSCTDPVYVTSCDPPVPVVAVEVEIVCNPETDLQEYHIFTSVDGVLGDPTVVTTDVACDAEPIDYEQVRVCDQVTGTYHILTSGFDSDGVAVVMNDLDTGQPCGEDAVPECVKWSSIFVQIDNTGTSFKEATEFTITNTDGSVDTFTVGPVAGWSDQVIAIAAAMDAAQNGTYDPRCTTGCGGLLTPPADSPPQPGIAVRYVNGVHCPTDLKIPVKAEAARPSGKVVTLPFYVIQGPEYRGQICRTCEDGAGDLQFEDGTPVPAADLPVCTFSCAEEIPAPPLSACQFEVIPGNWCDIIIASDPDEDDQVAQSEIIITVSTCGAEQTVSYGILDGDAIEPYEPVGTVVDCETGEEPFVEPPACPEGAVFEQVCVPGDNEFILDNSLWDDGVTAPTPHLQNGKDLVVALFDAAGNELTRTGPLPDPYFNGFINSPPDGCNVVPVCANHTSPKGCNANHAANLDAFGWYDPTAYPADIQNNLANPDQAELWASGWGVRCAGCGEPPAQAKIVDSSDPAWIGVAKNLTVYTQPETILFRAVTCDGTFWQDCDGNDVPAPAGGCCAKPCTADSGPIETALDCAVVECPDPKAKAFLLPTPGRPFGAGTYNPLNGPAISGDTIQEFEANMVAAGYDVSIGWAAGGPQGEANGEQHWYCPCDGGTFTWAGETTDVECIDNPDPNFVAETDCALQTTGKNDDRRDDKLDSIIDLLGQLVECLCGPCPEELTLTDTTCRTYNNPLSTGYQNWDDADDFKDLADEQGCTPGPNAEHWLRIVEHDCAGVAQPSVGTIVGPYSIPSPNGTDQAITDIGAATASSCITVAPNLANPVQGSGHTIDISWQSGVDSTLIVQEGVSDGAGGVCWYDSAQGFGNRVQPDGSDQAFDFMVSSNYSNAAPLAVRSFDELSNRYPTAPVECG